MVLNKKVTKLIGYALSFISYNATFQINFESS